jgi:hypothetical protein
MPAHGDLGYHGAIFDAKENSPMGTIKFVTKSGEKIEIETVIAEPGTTEPLGSPTEITPSDQGLETSGECAGAYTRAIAYLHNPPYQMNVVNAQNVNDILGRARKCRSDVYSANWFTPAILICAPYIECKS